MDKRLIEEFMMRNRRSVGSLKAEWWARRAGSSDVGSSLAVGHAMMDHARAVDPSFPSPESREADLEHHVQLKGLIERANSKLFRR